MSDLIRKIINHESLDVIYENVKDELFRNGPVSNTILETISYLKLFAPDYFENVESELLSIMGVFYKNPHAISLHSMLFEMYGDYISQTYKFNFTPMQANIITKIKKAKVFSFSAPTSTGKSYVFRYVISTSQKDVAIIVPSRALINEYYDRICELINDKTVNILTFVDIINTKHAKRSIFILTPERAKELFKYKDRLDMEIILFDEAQLSDEDSIRGLYFDSIVRRSQVAFQNSKFIFSHPFIDNPEAQLQKNNFPVDNSSASKYDQKNVGQLFFAHDGTSYYHFGLDVSVMGHKKIKSDFDPIMRAIRTGGSVLIYTTKASIYNRSVFDKFNSYIDECKPITDPVALKLIEQLKKFIGANEKNEGYCYSNLIENMKKGIVTHHGSLPLQARLILEHFTQKGFCRICFATSTLEQGINMPFDVVYLNTFQASKTLSMKNLIGRAGRSTTNKKFDYGSVIVKTENMSAFRNVMIHTEKIKASSLLDSAEETDVDYGEFKTAINSGNYSDEYNLTSAELQRLSCTEIESLVAKTLDSLFQNGDFVSLQVINQDPENKYALYFYLRELYRYHIDGRLLSAGEESVLNTAIRIILWKIHLKTFKEICRYRYAFAARIPEQRVLSKRFKNASSLQEKNRIKQARNSLNSKFIRGFDDLPNKELRNYGLYPNETKAINIDYDRIVFDTYDYLDKLIGFKLSDIYYAIFDQYYMRSNDERAAKTAKYFKYGTDDDKEIWMLRYGLSFEDIEVLKPYICAISQEEMLFSDSIRELPDSQLKSIERYLLE